MPLLNACKTGQQLIKVHHCDDMMCDKWLLLLVMYLYGVFDKYNAEISTESEKSIGKEMEHPLMPHLLPPLIAL